MKSILRELYGKLAQEEYTDFKDSDYILINERIREEREYIISKLSLEDGERLINLETMYTTVSSNDEAESFCKGFKLAALVMSEVFGI